MGCAFRKEIIYPDTFSTNPDSNHPVYSTEDGIYEKGCGLKKLMLSWGHDEYLYHIVRCRISLLFRGNDADGSGGAVQGPVDPS